MKVLPLPVAPPESGLNTITGFLSFFSTANTTHHSLDSPAFTFPFRAGLGTVTEIGG
ncbi:MAG: hypothetical protein PVG39_08120 [Desulfobacteraceae bacterium]|jgi:hypothetical protein